MFTPDLKPMVDMAIANLRAVSELVPSGDEAIPQKAAKHARRAKALVGEVIQQINDLMQAQKAAIAKEVEDHGLSTSGEGVDGAEPVAEQSATRGDGTKAARIRK